MDYGGFFGIKVNHNTKCIYPWSKVRVAHRAAKETSDWFDEHMDELFETISDSVE